MKRIIFVCHGNICRSVAAEFIMKSLTKDFDVCSRAVSREEIGNDIYPPMKKVLEKNNIPFSKHHALIIDLKDFKEADYIFYMDESNYYYLRKILPYNSKTFPIYRYTPSINEIEDPWYTGNFEKVVNELTTCIKDIIKNIDK